MPLDANDRGLRVVAEGVENEVIYRCTQALGCPLRQGNRLAPPMGPGSLPLVRGARVSGPHAGQ